MYMLKSWERLIMTPPPGDQGTKWCVIRNSQTTKVISSYNEKTIKCGTLSFKQHKFTLHSWFLMQAQLVSWNCVEDSQYKEMLVITYRLQGSHKTCLHLPPLSFMAQENELRTFTNKSQGEYGSNTGIIQNGGICMGGWGGRMFPGSD